MSRNSILASVLVNEFLRSKSPFQSFFSFFLILKGVFFNLLPLTWNIVLVAGKVTTYQHRIPKGNWFEYMSCPHYFFEILIYLAFLLVGGLQHTTLFSIVIFVLDNQLVAGYITHMWYHSEFPNYPKNRAAVIPFLI